MPKLNKETVNIPPSGSWSWNDETQTLEFTCFSTPVEIEGKGKKNKTSTYQEHIRIHLEKILKYNTSSRGGCSTLKKTAGTAKLNAFKASTKSSQRDTVTIEKIKQVAVALVQEKDGLPIPQCFLNMIQSRELDEFLAGLLLYLSCHLEKRALEERPKALMTEQSVMEKQVMAETSAKVELAKKHLGFCYSALVLGLGLSQQHHMVCGRTRVSSTYRDRHLYECLYSFFCCVAWVTFGRQDLKGIQAEIGHLFRSDLFNPALRPQGKEPEGEQEELQTTQKEGQSETKGPRQAVLNNRKSQRGPALSSIVTQRSPIMVSLLPSPREKAPHLFQTFFSHKQQPATLSDSEALMEELRQQLASLNFGILGKPLSQFSYTTLVPHGDKNEVEEEGDEDSSGDDCECESEGHRAQVRDSRPSFTGPRSTTADKYSSFSRANTVASRTTTEALSSDTE
ncbi:protein phosphatase 1 regulatory subunit 36 [Electrophorus electricus]|uniref:protein phosphatase 1 regulatory subunit 36 n=1 Tax=Electrophorus electricus TaxID=8005 RepID=UPI0015CFCF6A|nr:protein phosphatase 1 regulatory subunit 36 [Electrophorus electricus]